MRYTRWNPSDILAALGANTLLLEQMQTMAHETFDEALMVWPASISSRVSVVCPPSVARMHAPDRQTAAGWPAFRNAVHDALVAEAIRLGVPKRAR